MERKPDRGLVLYGRLGFIEHVSHAKAELAHGGGTVVLNSQNFLAPAGRESFTVWAGHKMDLKFELGYKRLFFIFHRHILVVVYGMSIL